MFNNTNGTKTKQQVFGKEQIPKVADKSQSNSKQLTSRPQSKLEKVTRLPPLQIEKVVRQPLSQSVKVGSNQQLQIAKKMVCTYRVSHLSVVP